MNYKLILLTVADMKCRIMFVIKVTYTYTIIDFGLTPDCTKKFLFKPIMHEALNKST